MERLSENEGLEGRSLPWLQLGFEAQVDASETTIRRAMGSFDYHKCLVNAVGSLLPAKKTGWSMQSTCLKDISSLRVGIVFDSAMKYTLDGAHSTSFGLYGSLENDTVSTVFSTVMHRSQRMRNAFIAGLQLDMTPSQTLFSTMYQVM